MLISLTPEENLDMHIPQRSQIFLIWPNILPSSSIDTLFPSPTDLQADSWPESYSPWVKCFPHYGGS